MNLPEVNVSPENLYRMSSATIPFRLLTTAIKLKIFNHLSEPKSAGQVAEAISGHPRNTAFFLNGLVACDLLTKKSSVYCNTPISQTFLVEGTPTSLGQGFLHRAVMSERQLADLSKLILEGPPSHAPGHGVLSEEEWAGRATWMANHERAGIAQQMSRMVADLPEFPSFQKMIDLGGGPGMFGIAMVKRHPFMKGVIFDRKTVVNVAQGFIQEYGMESRMEVLAGDYNCDPIGEGYDLVWASETLNFAQHNMDAVMAKIYDALNPKGVFINLSEGLTDEGTRPRVWAIHMVVSAMSNPMTPFEQGVIADAMLKRGFRSVRSRTLSTEWGPMDMDIARK